MRNKGLCYWSFRNDCCVIHGKNARYPLKQFVNSLWGGFGTRRRRLNVANSWDIAPCSQYVKLHFGGSYRLHLQGRKPTDQETSLLQVAACLTNCWTLVSWSAGLGSWRWRCCDPTIRLLICGLHGAVSLKKGKFIRYRHEDLKSYEDETSWADCPLSSCKCFN
jgi:hypothetical protein